MGNINISESSSLGIFGPAASSVSMVGGNGSTLDMIGYATLNVADATLAMDTMNLNVASVSLGSGALFDDGQPAINVGFNSVLVDNTVSGILMSPVSSCFTGGKAYNNSLVDLCPALP